MVLSCHAYKINSDPNPEARFPLQPYRGVFHCVHIICSAECSRNNEIRYDTVEVENRPNPNLTVTIPKMRVRIPLETTNFLLFSAVSD